MHLTARIAFRFLRLRRNSGAVTAIATVSIVGIAVAVAAIICVLSVFNGFKAVLTQRSDRMLTDIEIRPTNSKILPADSILDILKYIPEIEDATDIVSDQALVIFNNVELPVNLYAADYTHLRRMTDIDSIIREPGRFPEADALLDKAPEALIAVGPAARLGILNQDETLFLFTPKRVGSINPSNPASSFITDSVTTVGVFESGDERFDASALIVHPEVARALLMYDDNQANIIAINGRPGTNSAHLAKKISAALEKNMPGSNLSVQTREEMQQTSFRMVNIEKWVTFMLLIFMLVIASFNIISTMTIFVLEKQRDIAILRALGMTRRRIGRIFARQSVMVTAIGTTAGMLLGLLLSLGQQHFGWLTMGGNPANGVAPMPYPMKVEFIDFPILLIPIAGIACVTAVIASVFAKRLCAQRRL